MIHLDGHLLTMEDFDAVATGGSPCALGEEACVAMQASRDVVDRLVASGGAVYGITVGYGPLSGHVVDPPDLEAHQLNLLHHLTTGQGPLLSEVETRAVVLARCTSLARGCSGIRPHVVDLLLRALSAGVLPEIPEEGSVGASGDLVPLAHMARLAVGLGHARTPWGRLPAPDALARVGLTPVVLGSKEGLALVNGTSMMTGLHALSVAEAESLVAWAEFLSSALYQVLDGSPEALDPRLHAARGHAGQVESARRMRAYLADHPAFAAEMADGPLASRLVTNGEIQDPYSLRCAPQVLGAVRDLIQHARMVALTELNAATDNPLLFPGEAPEVVHGGNFFGQQIAFASDVLRLGVVQTALLQERQIDRLLNWRYSRGLPPLLTGARPGLHSGLAGCQLLATSLAAELRMLASPASVQTIPTNANNQDVVSMGATAALWTRRALPLAWRIGAVLALSVAQAVDLRDRDGSHVAGPRLRAFVAGIRAVSPPLVEDRPLDLDVEAIRALLADPVARACLLGGRP